MIIIIIIVVVGALTRCALFHSVWGLKVAQMIVPRNLIQEIKLYEFELGDYAVEINKNSCRAKGEGAVDYSIVTRWLVKFRLGCKNLNDQTRSVRPKDVNFDAMPQTSHRSKYK